ncbi:hypothetical protein RB195_019279 [Necator americanus]|uniref:Chondroitin proteoglycan 4 domain-containing protein n=1 Tax=Necator americanus TaxID=51031 RepID=A0ABR1CGA9_NECAM
MWTHLLFTVVLASVSESKIQKQCLCEPYKKCEEKFKPATNFKRCMRNCKERVDGDVPESYFECLSQFNHVLTKTLKCTYEAVGTGCTSNEKNVLSKRNFTLFEEIFLNDFHEIAEKVDVAHAFKTKAAEDMSRCLLSCFYPAENMCTRLLMCGVFMPNELRLLDNLTKCALKSDVSRGIMMEIATCMTSVVETPRTTTTALTEE